MAGIGVISGIVATTEIAGIMTMAEMSILIMAGIPTIMVMTEIAGIMRPRIIRTTQTSMRYTT